MKRVLSLVITLSVTLSLIACASEKKTSGAAPDFTLNDGQGNAVSLSDYSGKVVILDFWATWCPPCRMEIPHFIELQNEYGDKGLQIIGVSVDREGWAVVTPFISENGINYPIVMTDQQAYQVYQELLPQVERGGVPFTFIIDKKGIIQDKFVGYRDKEFFEAAIKPLLGM
jgi:cytochrome c biogenesis protein CcmG/thiol:disulfide interchange protein DsbE